MADSQTPGSPASFRSAREGRRRSSSAEKDSEKDTSLSPPPRAHLGDEKKDAAKEEENRFSTLTDYSMDERAAAGEPVEERHHVEGYGEERIVNGDDLTPLKFLAILALNCTYVGSLLHNFFTGPSLSFISKDLGLGGDQSWVPLAASVATACTAPQIGYLQDIFGRKAMLVIGAILQIAGTIAMGASQNFPTIVAGSVMSGIASAMQELTAIAAVSELVRVRWRGLFLALNTLLSLIFTPTLLYTELISTSSTWRWMYWISLIWNGLAFAGLLATYFRLKLEHVRPRVGMSAIKHIDYVGAVLLAVGLALLLVALQAGGNKYSWSSAYILCQLIIGIVLLIALGFWEWHKSRNNDRPMIPFRIFKGQRVVGLAFVITFLSGMNYHTAQNLGPTLIQSIFQFDAITTGLLGFGAPLGFAVSSTLVNVLLSAFRGRARELLVVSTVIMTAFTGAQACLTPDNSTTFAVLSSIASLGIGGTLVPLTTVVTLACPEDLIGTAVALATTMRTVGGSVGYAIFYNVFIHNVKETVPETMAQYAINAGLPAKEAKAFIGLLLEKNPKAETLPGVNKQILQAANEGLKWGTANASHDIYYGAIAVGGAAIIASVLLPNIRRFMTDRILQHTRTE